MEVQTTQQGSATEPHVARNRRQHLFLRYSFAILVDLTVINLFNQYWEHVYIENFSISLLMAVLLQLLLSVTLKVEHHVADFFKARSGLMPKIMRFVSAWAILFGSKLLMLWSIQFAFGHAVAFHGAVHGMFTFIAVVVAIIIAEQAIIKVNRMLA